MPDVITGDHLAAFQRVLDPQDNSTGGGTASAVAGAMAAALVAMVARLSVGPNASQPEQFYHDIAERGGNLRAELLTGGDEDARAFDGVMAAYRLPKGDETQVAERRAAIHAAMIHAARVPLGNAGRCAAVLELAGALQGQSNPNAASDLQCAGYLARAGLQGCLANVDINLSGIKDADARAAIEAAANELRGR